MSFFTEIDPPTLRQLTDDPFAHCEVSEDAVVLASDQVWAVIETFADGRSGGYLLSFEKDRFDKDRPITLPEEAYDQLSQTSPGRLVWLSLNPGIDLPLASDWIARDDESWVWLATTEIEPRTDTWHLIELDDLADADEINQFALNINPLTEADAGKGVNLFWLGARDPSGALLGCCTAHPTVAGVGHLAGLAVHPKTQGQGLGTALVKAVSQRVLERDSITTISAYAFNQNAIRLYQRVGYHFMHQFKFRFTEPRR